MDREKLQRGLGLFLDAMRPYAVSVIQRECPENMTWDMDFERKITNDQKRTNWQMNRMKLVNNGSSITTSLRSLSIIKKVSQEKLVVITKIITGYVHAYKNCKIPVGVGRISIMMHWMKMWQIEPLAT